MEEKKTVSIQDCEAAWAKFDKYKKTAEQHEFPRLFGYDMILVPLYNDLHVNWSVDHGERFLKMMNQLFEKLGIKEE